ncbi:MAG: hypothetical protein ACE5EW_06275 [Thermoplasmata archaeon]
MSRRRLGDDQRGIPRPPEVVGKGLRRDLIMALLIACLLSLPVQQARGQASLPITMGEFFFGPGSISLDPGENVTLHLVNDGTVRHTFTLFAEANADVPVLDNAALLDFYARSPTLVDVELTVGQEVTLNFTVPETEGRYTFVCIISGHSVNGMHGLLFGGVEPGDGNLFGGIGIVQGLLLISLVGVAVFAVIYQIRSTRP